MSRKWTKQEDQLIVDHLIASSKLMLKKLPGRTDIAIKNRIRKLLGQTTTASVAVKNPLPSMATVNYRNVRSGHRKDLGILVRSGWEGNFLRYLNHIKVKWEYEPETFFLQGNKTRAYCPDVHMLDHPVVGDAWVEIKGRVQTGTFTKMNAFKKQYPDIFAKLYGVCEKNTAADRLFSKLGIPILFYYKDFANEYKNILKNWEGSK
jgi:hypothetical protein